MQNIDQLKAKHDMLGNLSKDWICAIIISVISFANSTFVILVIRLGRD